MQIPKGWLQTRVIIQDTLHAFLCLYLLHCKTIKCDQHAEVLSYFIVCPVLISVVQKPIVFQTCFKIALKAAQACISFKKLADLLSSEASLKRRARIQVMQEVGSLDGVLHGIAFHIKIITSLC